MRRFFVLLAFLAVAFGCAGLVNAHPGPVIFVRVAGAAAPTPTQYPIQHIVVIMQENRSVDNFFHGFCAFPVTQCANTATTGKISTGATITLGSTPAGIVTSWDPGHQNGDWRAACDPTGGNSSTCLNDAFDKESCTGGSHCSTGCTGVAAQFAYCFVLQSYVQEYWNMATSDGVLSDMTFEENEGPSLNNHMYMLGSASYVAPASNLALANNMTSGNAGCQNTGTTSQTVDMTSSFTSPTIATYSGTGAYAGSGGCIDEPTITDLLDSAHLSWNFRQGNQYPNGTGGLWSAANNFYHICLPNTGTNTCTGADWNANVIAPPSGHNTEGDFQIAVQDGLLPAVTWIVPIPNNSDHPNATANTGPSYVATLVNAVGNCNSVTPCAGNDYWDHTIIIVEWDDWGGWYDHVTPPAPAWNATDPYEYGFRVPVMVLSPYAKTGIVDHTTRGRECVNKLIETIFALPSISARSIDQYCEDNFIGSSLNFAQPPNPYVPI